MNDKKSSLRLEAVSSRAAMQRFIRLPYSLYADDPVWVPPLDLERREHFSARNPFFAHAEWQAWLAYRGSQIVGRISAQIDHLHLQRHQDGSGFFGLLEAVEDEAVFALLLETAERWLRQRGMQRVLGPLNLSINQECGLLVSGFETPPVFMMGHALPYYADYITANGYRKAKDLFAYWICSRFEPPPLMRTMVDKTLEKARLHPLRRSAMGQELEILRDIYNDAWTDNWNFAPFTEAEFAQLGQFLKLFVSDDMIQIAEIGGEPVAMIVVLPNLNEAIRDLNGKLLPLGWWKLLKRLKFSYPKTGRVPLMGVRRRYQRSRLGIGLAFAMIDAVRAPTIGKGIEAVEMSWILEDNKGMRDILDCIGADQYKQYRIYTKELQA